MSDNLKYRGIIFDFNGTLFFDSDKHEEAWRRFASKYRKDPVTQDEFYLHFHGHPARDIVAYLLGYQPEPVQLNQLIQEKEEDYRQICKKDSANFHLSPGASELLDHLKRSRVPFTVATALEITNLSFFIREFNLEKWFDPDKIVFDDGSFPGKPAPDIYLRAAKILDCLPSELIVVEDAPSGIQAAKGAGIGLVIGIDPLGHRKLPGADFMIRDFNEFDVELLGL